MKGLQNSFISFLISILLLILVEVITTTILPLVGLGAIRFSFFTLLILFVSFYKNSNLISLYIIVFSFVHSIFSVETWYLSAFIGIFSSVVVAYFSELINLSNNIVTMLFVLIFQFVMVFARTIVFYLRGNNLEYIFHNFVGHLFEIFILTLLSPFVFELLSVIWASKSDSMEDFN